MYKSSSIILSFLLLCIISVPAQTYWKDITVHDPVMIKQDSIFYIFCTGNGIGTWSSPNMKNWKREKPVFSSPPKWATDTIPGFRGHIWAPDISYYNGKYYLFYSVSSFGKNSSAIGLATNVTLHQGDPKYKWTDHGQIIQSYPGKNNWNAIDPNLITAKDGKPYLAFGSFWDGIKLVELNKDRLSVANNGKNITTIASRINVKSDENLNKTSKKTPAENPIEAPFIYRKGAYYYLFVSADYCCKGAKSDYKVLVGRSKSIKGPFLDRNGVSMNEGGGTLLLEGNQNWYGVGHNAVINYANTDYMVFHGYDALDRAIAKLLIRKISWVDGWPSVSLEIANN